jgi:hypothetical protein
MNAFFSVRSPPQSGARATHSRDKLQAAQAKMTNRVTSRVNGLTMTYQVARRVSAASTFMATAYRFGSSAQALLTLPTVR